MSISSIQAIKEAEDLSAATVTNAKEEAKKLSKEMLASADQKQEEQLKETNVKREEMIAEAKKKAKEHCQTLEHENESIKKVYQEPDKSNIELAIEEIKARILKHGS